MHDLLCCHGLDCAMKTVYHTQCRWCAVQLGIPVTEVHVTWTEMPGSKLRVTSVAHMALELLLLKVCIWDHRPDPLSSISCSSGP